MMVIASELIDFVDFFQNMYKNLVQYYFSWTRPGPAFRFALSETMSLQIIIDTVIEHYHSQISQLLLQHAVFTNLNLIHV
jgi:tagatose-1,6-bisphosphate aldolase non-catalytic subunit AgaZ/GatZ